MIRKILKELEQYLSIRGVGKTTLLKDGVDEYNRYHWIVVPTIEYGHKMFGRDNKLHNYVTLNNLTNNLRGTSQAMVIDQEANLQIFKMALNEIDKLDTEIEMINRIRNSLLDLIGLYQSDSHALQNHIMCEMQIKWWEFSKRWFHRKSTKLLMELIQENSKRYSDIFNQISELINSNMYKQN
jgi:hypothetical protein